MDLYATVVIHFHTAESESGYGQLTFSSTQCPFPGQYGPFEIMIVVNGNRLLGRSRHADCRYGGNGNGNSGKCTGFEKFPAAQMRGTGTGEGFFCIVFLGSLHGRVFSE